jgi:small subunit ribosomal protein S20
MSSRSDIDQATRAPLLLNEAHPVANIKSQIKRNGTNEAARLRNKAVKSALKTAVRKFREAAESGDAAAAQAAARHATRALDKAASKGVIHKNQAANRKSAISSRAAELTSA